MTINPDVPIDISGVDVHRPTVDLGARVVADSTADLLEAVAVNAALVLLLVVGVLMLAYAVRGHAT